VKDMLALLRFAENPRDRVAGFRVLNLLPGIGPNTSAKILDDIGTVPRPIEKLVDTPAPPRGSEGWPDFVRLMTDLGQRVTGWPTELERARLWYEPVMEQIHEDAESRKLDLAQLCQIAAGYPSREKFLTELTLDPPEATSDQAGVPLLDEDYLILSTIHSAKGQEWKSVYVLNVVDGAIPSDLGTGSTHELEEERRLLYVAMTRAKDDLHLVVPQRFYVHAQTQHGDKHVYAQRSRFITRGMLEHFENVMWPAVTPYAKGEIAPGAPRIDVGAAMRGMWAAK